ncbi:sushi domain-containing protein 3 [Betta splendens]|uniref:Sushi domain-containing protein 3 n=1 Tax=Betta splendens TaxID=158456 RepID=A0A6P7MYJ4_BETSP|nr:sushi domain-containing protein 3 [Betta splendens]
MPAATAPMADASPKPRDRSARTQAQCAPRPLPALGTQRIIQGNGTDVGTVLSLQCPDKHKLVGGELKCVLAVNSTHWVGETYCKPLSLIEDYGFRVAVLASIVSLGVIFIMSVAFITCCLLDCIREDERKKQQRESDLTCEEQVQHRGEIGSHYSHKGRNNNNNTREKMAPAACEGAHGCRCQGDAAGPHFTHGCSSPAALPGPDYGLPLLPRNPEPARPAPLSYPGPLFSCQTSLMGPDLLHGEQQRRWSQQNPPPTDESNAMNPVKEFSIRIISV